MPRIAVGRSAHSVTAALGGTMYDIEREARANWRSEEENIRRVVDALEECAYCKRITECQPVIRESVLFWVCEEDLSFVKKRGSTFKQALHRQ